MSSPLDHHIVGPMKVFQRSDEDEDVDVDVDVDGGGGSSSFLCFLGGWVNSLSEWAILQLVFFLSFFSISFSL